MEAVVFATGVAPGMEAQLEQRPVQLLPLVDRPFLQSVVDLLAEQRIERLHFVLSHLPEQVEAVFEDGCRWGVQIVYHTVPDAEHPYDLLRALELASSPDPVLLVHGDRLVEGPLAGPEAVPLLYHATPLGATVTERQWTGWACIPGAWLAGVPRGADRRALEAYLVERVHGLGGGAELVALRRCVSLQTVSTFLAAQWAVLEGLFKVPLLWAREEPQGVRLGRNVKVRPGATLVPPVYIGDGACIGAGAVVGPRAVVGAGSLVDSRSRVSDSVILPHSYVGVGVQLERTIVDRGRLLSGQTGEVVPLMTGYVLADMSAPDLWTSLSRLLGRAAAGLLLIPGLVVMLLTFVALRVIRGGRVWHTHPRLRLPASPDDEQWETFGLYSFDPLPEGSGGSILGRLLVRGIPGLLNVVKGDLDLIGVAPRSPSEVRRLSSDWRELYLGARAGLLTEAWARWGDRATEREIMACETYYAASSGPRADLSILGALLGRAVLGALPTEAFGQGDGPEEITHGATSPAIDGAPLAQGHGRSGQAS